MKVVSKLGSGGFGSVYRCTDSSGNSIAVKILKNDSYGIRDPIELSIMATYEHPYISNSYDIQYIDNMIWIFQEEAICNIQGYTRVYDIGDFLLMKWTKQLCSALCCLHREDIIHGDIKPQNILVFRNGDIKLCDFSLSIYKLSENDTYTNTMGTMIYTANEILLQQNWSTPVDIWSLGCTLYEISCGKALIMARDGVKMKKREAHSMVLKSITMIDSTASKYLRGKKCNVNSVFHEDFIARGSNFVNLIMMCLRKSSRHRPDIEDIIQHRYVFDDDSIEYSIDTSSSYELDDDMKTVISKICKKYIKNSRLIDSISKMYSRCKDLIMKNEYKIYGCLWICHKLITQTHVDNFPLQLYEIRDIERRIVEHLEYKLHIMD